MKGVSAFGGFLRLFRFRLTFQSEAGHLLIDAVDGSRPQNDLILSRVVEGSFHFVDGLDPFLVHLFPIADHQPQPRGAMGDQLDVLLSTDRFHDLFCNQPVLRFFHDRFPSLNDRNRFHIYKIKDVIDFIMG